MSNFKKLSHLENRAKQEIKLDQDLIILTIISSLLAAYGIKMDNSYVLIGSMLVSPLFDPVISSVIFYTTKNIEGYKQSLKSLFISLLIASLVSTIFWVGYKYTGQLELFVYSDITVNILDTLVVAILMGIVGTLFWIWPKSSNTTAGVAIAISLVPPIANSTAGLVLGNLENSFGHLGIFIINLLGIFLGSILILFIYSRGKYKTKL